MASKVHLSLSETPHITESLKHRLTSFIVTHGKPPHLLNKTKFGQLAQDLSLIQGSYTLLVKIRKRQDVSLRNLRVDPVKTTSGSCSYVFTHYY